MTNINPITPIIATLPFSPPNFKIKGSMIDKINKIVGNKEPAVIKISLKLPVFAIPIAIKLITVPNSKEVIPEINPKIYFSST